MELTIFAHCLMCRTPSNSSLTNFAASSLLADMVPISIFFSNGLTRGLTCDLVLLASTRPRTSRGLLTLRAGGENRGSLEERHPSSTNFICMQRMALYCTLSFQSSTV